MDNFTPLQQRCVQVAKELHRAPRVFCKSFNDAAREMQRVDSCETERSSDRRVDSCNNARASDAGELSNEFGWHLLKAACLVSDRWQIVEMILHNLFSETITSRRNDHGNEAMLLAASYGNVKGVEVLVAAGCADITFNDQAPLRLAAAAGHLAVIRVLLTLPGVVPEAQSSYALRLAAANGHTPVVELLMTDGRAKPNALANDALQMAAFYGHADVVELLVSDKRVHDNNKDCVAAFLSVSALGFDAVVQVLLKHVVHCREPSVVLSGARRAVSNQNPKVLDELWRASSSAFIGMGESLDGSIGLALRPHWLNSIKLFLMAHDRRLSGCEQVVRGANDATLLLALLPGDVLREIAEWCVLPTKAGDQRGILDD
jgi:ankyrin repeat protein